MTTVTDIAHKTARRIKSTARFAVETPVELARAAADTSLGEAALFAKDVFYPADHVLAEPPRGTGLKPVLGNAGQPLVGGVLDMTGDRVEYARKGYDEFGPIWWTFMAGRRFINVVGPDAVKQVLINSNKDFSNDGWQMLIGPFFDRGLMLLSFGEHLNHRRIMQSAFHPRQLDNYLSGMDRRITADLASSWPTEGEIPMYPRMKDLAMRVAADVFLGMELDKPQREKLLAGFHAQARAGTEFFRLDFPFTLWGRGRDGYDNITRFFRQELPNKRAGKGDDLFSAMVHATDDDGAKFTDEEIIRHMNFLWFAAHDTTTLAMAMMAWAFAAHPEWQHRAYQESKAIGDGPLQPDDLEALVTIDLVMKEVMRLWSPVPAMLRQAVRDVDLDGYYVPKGTYLHVMSPGTHMLPEYWKDPETFDPGRFEKGREEHKAHSHVYYPFGAGAHKCIGFAFAELETKAMWHRLLLSRRFSVDAGYKPPMGWKALPEPTDNLPIRVSPR